MTLFRASRVSLALLVLASACQLGRAKPNVFGDQDLIEASELQSTRHNNLYDVVHQLRPQWFTRGQRSGSGPADRRIMLYINDRQIGIAADLRSYPATFPLRMRYMRPTEAQVRFGPSNRMRAAILIETEQAR